jgi:hypothetical protein
MIDFINPLYLLFIAAGAIPLLIHLFQRHRAKVVEFSSIRLLKGSEKRTIRWVRLRHILLLLIRSLIIILIVLALTHPLMKGIMEEEIASHLPTSVVMVIDNSMSMGWIDSSGTLLDKSIDRILQIVDKLNEGDRCALLFVRDPESAPVIVEGMDGIRKMVEGIETLPARLDISRLILMGNEMLEEMPGPYREIYLFTDMQASSFEMGDEGVNITEDLHVVFFNERNGEAWNRAITRLELEEAPITPEGKIHLIGEVIDRGADPPNQEVIVAIRPEDGEQYLQEITLDGEGRGRFSFPLYSPSGGVTRGYVEVDADPLTADNRRYFTVRLPGRPRIWLLDSGDRRSPLKTAIRILGEEIGSVELKTGLTGGRLGSRDLIVIEAPSGVDVENFRPLISRQLGEASILFVPPESEREIGHLNELLSMLGLPDRYSDLVGSEKGDYVRIGEWTSMTGEVERFVNEYQDALSTLKFIRYFSLYGGEGDAGDETIEFDSRAPWISMKEDWDGGWRIMLSSGFGRWWGDMYRNPLFVPFIDMLFRDIVSRGGLLNASFMPGETVLLDLPGMVNGIGIDLLTPEGEVNRIYPAGELLSHRAGMATGNFRLMAGEKDAGGFSVNPDGRESILEEISDDDLRAFLGGLVPEIVRSGDGFEEKILIERGGWDIWWELLLLAFVLLFVEGALANRRKI